MTRGHGHMEEEARPFLWFSNFQTLCSDRPVYKLLIPCGPTWGPKAHDQHTEQATGNFATGSSATPNWSLPSITIESLDPAHGCAAMANCWARFLTLHF